MAHEFCTPLVDTLTTTIHYFSIAVILFSTSLETAHLLLKAYFITPLYYSLRSLYITIPQYGPSPWIWHLGSELVRYISFALQKSPISRQTLCKPSGLSMHSRALDPTNAPLDSVWPNLWTVNDTVPEGQVWWTRDMTFWQPRLHNVIHSTAFYLSTLSKDMVIYKRFEGRHTQPCSFPDVCCVSPAAALTYLHCLSQSSPYFLLKNSNMVSSNSRCRNEPQ